MWAILDGELPEVNCPCMFDITGGTRLFCVSNGPGQRVAREREAGKCEVSHGGEDPVHADFAFVPAKVTKELLPFLRTPSRFAGAKQMFRPSVWHDGTPKSAFSYDVFRRTALYDFEDCMHESAAPATADVFWEKALNRTDTDTVTTVLLFCSLETMYRILRKCNLITRVARICMPSGGFFEINIPIGAPASFTIAAGPYASNALHWGTVNQAEHDALHKFKTPGNELSASAAIATTTTTDSPDGSTETSPYLP